MLPSSLLTCCVVRVDYHAGIDDDEPDPFESFLFDPTLETEETATAMSTDDA